MITYLVIGICTILLLAVIFISAKSIGMGIEARRNLNFDKTNNEVSEDTLDLDKLQKSNISEEILKLSDLKSKGLITEDEYKKAKDKILN